MLTLEIKKRKAKSPSKMNFSERKMPETKFSYDEVYHECVEYFHGDELAATTWMNKYAMKSRDGFFFEKNPDEMHWRMAAEFARKEKEYKEKFNLNGSAKFLSKYGQKREFLSEEKIFNYFRNFKYIIPQGSVMSSLGNKNVLASLSNCIVLPEIYDSYGGILYTDQQMV